MPADFFLDLQSGMVFSKAIGVLSVDDVLDHMDRLQVHADFRPEFNQLFDFREVTQFPATYIEVRSLAQRAIFSTQSQRAFVVPADWQYSLGRMFGTYRELSGEEGIRLFRKMEDALTWLGLAAEPEASRFIHLA